MTRLTSDLFKIVQFIMWIRNYDSIQTNYRKILSSPLIRKSNLKIINIFGREILNCRSGRKKLSKTHRPKTGVAAPWELKSNLICSVFYLWPVMYRRYQFGSIESLKHVNVFFWRWWIVARKKNDLAQSCIG